MIGKLKGLIDSYGEDYVVLAIGIDQALEFSDHRLATFSRSAVLAR